MKLELRISLEEVDDCKRLYSILLIHSSGLENLDFDLEKSWKSTGKMHMNKCGNPESTRCEWSICS